MITDVILEDWADYNKRKGNEGKDVSYFSCDEAWEIFFLKNKILNVYPFVSDLKILEAIESSCCKEGKERKEFVLSVMSKLGFY